MFTGENQHRLDDKGRVILPASYRPHLEDGCYLVPSQERCIAVFPARVYDQWRAAQKATLDMRNRRDRAYWRRISNKAARQVPDSQGRIVVPPGLREFANLDRELMVNGSDDRVEIWDRAAYETYMDEFEQDFVDLSDPLGAA